MDKRRFERGAGVLCHISSLPGKYGIGSLGKEAYDFVDFLERSKIKYWQILPLVQTGYGDSPISRCAAIRATHISSIWKSFTAADFLTRKS